MQNQYVRIVEGAYRVGDTRVSLDSLGNQKEIDTYLTEGQREAQVQHKQSRQTNAELIAKLQRARNASEISG